MSIVEYGIEKGYIEKEDEKGFEHYTIHPRRVLNSFVLQKIKLEFTENNFCVYRGDDTLIHCVKPIKQFDYKKHYETIVSMVEALRSDSLVSKKGLFEKVALLYDNVRKIEEERNATECLPDSSYEN